MGILIQLDDVLLESGVDLERENTRPGCCCCCCCSRGASCAPDGGFKSRLLRCSCLAMAQQSYRKKNESVVPVISVCCFGRVISNSYSLVILVLQRYWVNELTNSLAEKKGPKHCLHTPYPSMLGFSNGGILEIPEMHSRCTVVNEVNRDHI